ncbi:MAG TPA: APC family permease [Terriglobales bacterium]|nr:APC family permease [Terriglobales bacterium]
MSKPKTFMREATGLTRELSLLDAIIFNLCVSAPGFGILLYTFYGPVSFPGVNLVYALLLATPFMLAHAVVSGQMMAAMPRSGFDYVFVSRVTHPVIGFANSFVFYVFQALFLGVFFVLMNSFISNFFSSLALISNNAGYNDIATMLTQPTWVIIVGTVLLIVITGIMLLGMRIGKKVLLITQLIGWIGLVAVLVIIAGSNQQVFAAAWNNYFGSQVTYTNALSTAQSQGLSYLPAGDPSALVGAALYSIFVVLGYQSVGYLGGEVKRGQINIIRSMVISLLFAVLVFAVSTIVITNAVGYDFLVSAAYLNLVGKLSVSVYYTLISTILYPNALLATIVFIGLFMWVFVEIMSICLNLTRANFAWAFDGVIPTFFASVSSRFSSPTWSVVTIGVLMEVGILVSLYTQAGVLINLALILIAVYSITTLSAALFPYLKPEFFKSSPKIANYKIGGKIPLITITGGVTTIFFWAVIYEMTVNTAIAGAVTPQSATAMIGVAIVAAVIYFGVRAYRKSKGLDIAFAFKEIPPE